MNVIKIYKKVFALLLVISMVVHVFPSSMFSVEASNRATESTVLDNGKVAENETTGVKYVSYKDISEYRGTEKTHPTLEGYVFAGWWKGVTEGAKDVVDTNLTAVSKGTTGGSAWAKFVPEEVLSVKVQISPSLPDVDEDNENVSLRLVTSVDSLKYSEVGFKVRFNNAEPEYAYGSSGVFSAIKVTDGSREWTETPKSAFHETASTRFATLKIINISAEKFYSFEFAVTPYWITKDGTTVSGISRGRILVSDDLSYYEDGEKFSKEDKTYTLKEASADNKASYQYFQGASDTVYLKGIYTPSGNGNERFGISIRNGGETRQIFFNGAGFEIVDGVDSDICTSGLYNAEGTERISATQYNNHARTPDGVYVWATALNQSGDTGTATKSAIKTMLEENVETEVIWVIENNFLYCSVSGEVVLRLPMTRLCNDWKDGRYYQLGVAGYNASSNTGIIFKLDTLKFGNDTYKENYIIQETLTTSGGERMVYEPITGSYMSQTGVNGYFYGSEVAANEPVAIEMEVSWKDGALEKSLGGLGLKIGDKTAQILTQHISKTEDGDYGTVKNYKDRNFNSAGFLRTNFQQVPFASGTEKSYKMLAAVYDGKVSIMIDGVTAYEAELSTLLTSYDAEANISLGMATANHFAEQIQFKNVKYYVGDEAIAAKTKDWTFYQGTAKEATITGTDYSTGTITGYMAGNAGWAKGYVPIQGTSNAWELTGTMNVGAHNNNFKQGFWITSSDKKVAITTDNQQLQVHNGSNYLYTTRNTLYEIVRKTRTQNSENTSKSIPISYKAVIANDTFYMWWDNELVWMIPLTENIGGGFEAGSDYNIALQFPPGSGSTTQATFTVQSKNGSEVDGDFVDTLKAAKMYKWNTGTQNTDKRLELTTVGMVRAVNTTSTDAKDYYANMITPAESIHLSGTYNMIKKGSASNAFRMFGVTITGYDSNGSALQGERQIRFDADGVNILIGHGSSAMDSQYGTNDNYKNATATDYVWAQYKGNDADKYSSVIADMLQSDVGTEYDVKWAIQDNTLYCSVNDKVCLVLPLNKIHANWKGGVKYSLGFSFWAPAGTGIVEVSDVRLATGNDATALLQQDINEQATKTNMVFNALDGSYIPYFRKNQEASIYGIAGTTVGVQTTVEWMDINNSESSVGITVKQGENAAWVPIEADATGSRQITAVVKGSVLHIWSNSEGVFEKALADIITDYDAETGVQIGITTKDANLGLIMLKDVDFWGADAVADFLDGKLMSIDAYTNGIDINKTTWSITRTAANASNYSAAYFSGASEVWEISGTMSQEDLNTYIPQGFALRVQNESDGTYKVTRFHAQNQGFRVVTNGAYDGYNTQTNGTTDTAPAGYAGYYILNKNDAEYFAKSDTGNRKTEISFRLLLVDDTLYLWQDDVLRWRIPVTEDTFGGYEAGSKYQVGISVDNSSSTNEVVYKNLSVKYGDVVDLSSIEYPHFATMSNSNMENVDAYAATAERTSTASAQKLYFAGTDTRNSAKRWEISGTMYRKNDGLASDANNVTMGFTVKSGDKEIYFFGRNKGFVVVNGSNWGKSFIDSLGTYVLADNTSYFNLTGATTVQEIQFRALLLEDVLYVYFNDVLSWQIPLTDEGVFGTFGTYSEDSTYYLGLVVNGTTPGTVGFKNLQVKSGMEIMTEDDFYIRDSYILVDDASETYYMYGTRFKNSFDVFSSTDLLTWKKQHKCWEEDDMTNWTGIEENWAPEVVAYDGAYYMFATFDGYYNDERVRRGTVVLKSDSPTGPFTEWSEGPVTPTECMCLDGTLYVEDGTPYLIYCHEYSCRNSSCSIGDIFDGGNKNVGTMMYIQLSSDLKTIADGASAKELFSATDVYTYPHADGDGYVTDGPQLYKNDNGLFLLWSTFQDGDNGTNSSETKKNQYVQLQVRLEGTFKDGITVKSGLPVLYGDATDEDGGHGMIFEDFDGNVRMALFTPNYYLSGKQHMELFEIDCTSSDELGYYLTAEMWDKLQ